MMTNRLNKFVSRKYAIPNDQFTKTNHTPSKKYNSLTSCQRASFSIFMVSSLESVSSWRSFSMFTSDRTSVTCSTDSQAFEKQHNILICTVCNRQQCWGSVTFLVRIRIHTSDLWIRIRLRIGLLSSVTYRMPKKFF